MKKLTLIMAMIAGMASAENWSSWNSKGCIMLFFNTDRNRGTVDYRCTEPENFARFWIAKRPDSSSWTISRENGVIGVVRH